MLRRRPITLLTHPEPCECCGTRVAVTRREDDGATRLSELDGTGRVLPGGHTPLACETDRARGAR